MASRYAVRSACHARPERAPRRGWRALAVLAAIGWTLVAGAAFGQPYASFDLPDSLLAGEIRALGPDFEPLWNSLIVSIVRSRIAEADSTKRLVTLARKVARVEPGAIGTHIAADVLKLRDGWDFGKLRVRARAATEESLAVVARQAQDFASAESLLKAAIADYHKVGDKRREAWVLGTKAAVVMLSGDFERAEGFYRDAIVARRALADPRLIANAWNDLGAVYERLGRYDEARFSLEEARAIREQSGQSAALGTTFDLLGLVYEGLGQPDSARIWYEKALEVTTARGDSARTLEVLSNYAGLLARTGSRARAGALASRALGIARALGDARREAELEQILGSALEGGGRGAESLGHLERAAQAFERERDPRRLAAALIGIGRSRLASGDLDGGRRTLERALHVGDSLADPGIRARALVALTGAARAEGNPDRTGRMAAQAIEAGAAAGDSSVVHDAATVLAAIAAERRDPVSAIAWQTRAAGAGEVLGERVRLRDLLAIADLDASLGRFGQAERESQQALAAAARAGASDIAWAALLTLGRVAAAKGDPSAALAHMRRVASAADTMSRRPGGDGPFATPLPGPRVAYESLIGLLAALEPRYSTGAYGEEAFDWAERCRVRALRTELGPQARRPVAAPATIASVQSALFPDEALLEYSVGDSATSLWVITHSAWKRVSLAGRPALRGPIDALRRGLADPATADAPQTRAAERALYTLLLGPAESMLARAERLIVSPDGALALVPFEALLARDVKDGAPVPRDSYVIERNIVTYAPAAGAFVAARAAGTERATGDIVALAVTTRGAAHRGGNRFDSDVMVAEGGATSPPNDAGLRPLESAVDEVAALKAAAAGARMVELIGQDASRERLAALPGLAGARIVHLAARGEWGAEAGLWLAPDAGGSEPSRLAARDIAGLEVGPGLVTLSGCEAYELPAGSDPAPGLAHAFLAAGAKNVIQSLWVTNDRFATQFYERLYRGVLKQGMDPGRALAEAKRSMLMKPETRSPYHWAAGLLVGEASAP